MTEYGRIKEVERLAREALSIAAETDLSDEEAMQLVFPLQNVLAATREMCNNRRHEGYGWERPGA